MNKANKIKDGDQNWKLERLPFPAINKLARERERTKDRKKNDDDVKKKKWKKERQKMISSIDKNSQRKIFNEACSTLKVGKKKSKKQESISNGWLIHFAIY